MTSVMLCGMLCSMAVYVAMEVALYRIGPNSDGVDDTFSDKNVAHSETCSGFWWPLLSLHTGTCALGEDVVTPCVATN